MSQGDHRLDVVDQTAQAVAERATAGVRSVVGGQRVDAGVAVIAGINARAEAAAAVAHAHGSGFWKRAYVCLNFCTALCAHYAIITWFLSFTSFCFAAGLLSVRAPPARCFGAVPAPLALTARAPPLPRRTLGSTRRTTSLTAPATRASRFRTRGGARR